MAVVGEATGGTPLGEFMQKLENEVRAQQCIVREMIQRVGCKESVESKAKQLLAWLVEKLGRFKLNGPFLRYSDLSRVVELESFATLAYERIGFWDNFDAVASTYPPLLGIAFLFFREQSEQHPKS